MDPGILIAILMLAVWAFGTVQGWGGWVNALLTVGIFLLIYRVVRRGTQRVS
jgi:hypothetical protein